MKFIKQTSILITLLISLTTNAAWIDKQGNIIPDSNNMKSVDGFVAQLVVTDQEAEVLKNWGTPSQSVYFPTADKIEINKIITAFIVFGGCATNIKGNCDLQMQITVFRPDGKVYAKLPVMEVWSGKPVPPNKSLGLSVEYMRVMIESHEQLGEYKIDVNIVDKVKNSSMVLTSYFTAVTPND